MCKDLQCLPICNAYSISMLMCCHSWALVPWYPLDRKLGVLLNHSAYQPAASHYTNCTIPAPMKLHHSGNILRFKGNTVSHVGVYKWQKLFHAIWLVNQLQWEKQFPTEEMLVQILAVILRRTMFTCSLIIQSSKGKWDAKSLYSPDIPHLTLVEKCNWSFKMLPYFCHPLPHLHNTILPIWSFHFHGKFSTQSQKYFIR
jgi:hypothetical protein